MSEQDSNRSDSWISTSKLAPPPLPASTLGRTQIERLLNADIPLVLLEAPAGYGKTTLLTQAYAAAREQGETVVWLAIDKDDDDARTFLGHLVIALERAGVSMGALTHAAPHGFAGTPLRNVSVQIANGVHAAGKAVIFFIDDLHQAASTSIMQVIESLLGQLKTLCRFIISTRIHLDLALAKMRSAGMLDILGPQDLRLSVAEAELLLRGHGTPGEIRSVIDHVEGWPVMIQLIRLSSRHSSAQWANLPKVTGQTTHLAEYLAEQVIADLPIDLQTVLMFTAVCERFNGDLVNELCGRDDGWAVVEHLTRLGLMLIPLDNEGIWYRYHPLFGEFLTGRLERRGGGMLAKLQRQAATWFAACGMLRNAIQQANASGDLNLTIKLLSEAGGWLVAFRGGTDILRIIARLPEEMLRVHPYLSLGKIYLLAQENRLHEARRQFTELLSRTSSTAFSSPEEEALFSVSASVLDALLKLYGMERIEPTRLLALQRRARTPLPPLLSAMITHLVGYARYCDGDYSEARQTGYAAAHQCRDAQADFIEIYSYLWLGDTHLELGELSEAEENFRQAVDRSIERFGPYCNQAVAGCVFLAELAYERNDLDLSEPLIRSAVTDIEQKDPWFSVYRSAYHVATEIMMRRKGPAAAIAFIDEAMERLRMQNLTIYAPFLALKKAEALTMAGALDDARTILASCKTPSSEAGPNGTRLFLLERIGEARLALASGRTDDAMATLGELLPPLAQRGHLRRTIKVKTLMALGAYQSGDERAAAGHLREALTLAAPEGLIGPILEEVPLLAELLGDGRIRAALSDLPNLADVLALLPDRTSDAGRPDPAHLSNREKQVLIFLADGMSGKEIARSTDLGVSTVLSYRKNLYRKLNVSSRSGAIAQGRRLGYL